MGQDDWRWHMYDTVKGSDWLGDQDAIEYLVPQRAGRRLRARALGRALLAHRGRQDLPARLRRHDQELRRGPPIQRTCAAADRTGHAMLHTLYGQALRNTTEFFIEYFALDLIMDEDGACRGVIA